VTASVVLVHGAWFSADYWDPVIAKLQLLGAAAVAVELPFGGFDTDVAAARHG
jgi:pimeloyl-ACP methyl ester carboxylesterase